MDSRISNIVGRMTKWRHGSGRKFALINCTVTLPIYIDLDIINGYLVYDNKLNWIQAVLNDGAGSVDYFDMQRSKGGGGPLGGH